MTETERLTPEENAESRRLANLCMRDADFGWQSRLADDVLDRVLRRARSEMTRLLPVEGWSTSDIRDVIEAICREALVSAIADLRSFPPPPARREAAGG